MGKPAKKNDDEKVAEVTDVKTEADPVQAVNTMSSDLEATAPSNIPSNVSPSKKSVLKKVIPSKKMMAGGFIVVILLAAVGSAGFFYFKYLETQGKLKDSVLGVKAEDQMNALIERVGEVAELPTGEMPQVATVSNIQELSGQPFFKNAKNGDKLLIYNTAGKAYLYRPETHKIIEIGPVVKKPAESISQPASRSATLGASTSVTPTPQEQVKVALLNGTAVTGLTRTAETALEEAKVDVEVVDRDNAKSSDYAESVVVDISGKNKDAVSKIASALGAKVSTLPEGEQAPNGAEILVILGSNYSKN